MERKIEKRSLCLACENLFVSNALGSDGEVYSRSNCLRDTRFFDYLGQVAQTTFTEKIDGALVPMITKCSHFEEVRYDEE